MRHAKKNKIIYMVSQYITIYTHNTRALNVIIEVNIEVTIEETSVCCICLFWVLFFIIASWHPQHDWLMKK